MQQQSRKKQSNWFQQLFCFCVRDEPTYSSMPKQKHLQTQMRYKSTSQNNSSQIYSLQECKIDEPLSYVQENNWLAHQLSDEFSFANESQILDQIGQEEDRMLLNKQLSYMSGDLNQLSLKFDGSEETKTSTNEGKLLHHTKGLLYKITNFNISFEHQKYQGKYHKYLLKMFYEQEAFDFNVFKNLME